VATAVLVRGGGKLYLVDPDSGLVRPCPSGSAYGSDGPTPRELESIRETLGPGDGPSGAIRVGVPGWTEEVRAAGLRAEAASLAETRRARELLPWPSFRTEREPWLRWARKRFARALASPEESLIALAREEERLERVLAREQGASDHWIAPETGPLAEYASEWRVFRTALERHHDALVAKLEQEAERTLPNLSAVVGPRTAAGLVASAGGLGALARVSASRLQLLGARRRAGGTRGPKYGVLARSVLGPEVPAPARGAYARSLAALAAIAARADATTRNVIAPSLLVRRSRRLAELRARYPP
jgi:hypothetical protein